ncbi:ankyrin repeat-containing protein [Quercus suber]|uniref:Ankyrin repeat-containing protein n=1 Tax=Quercus suber TaxID=58331 RepID=A0AAW0JED1_QUESU
MNTARLFDDAISGNIDSFNREISDGALISLEHVTPSGNCILHVAAKSGQAQIMKSVLDSLYPHSPLHATNFKGNTALHIAASLGYLYMSELLITRAIDQEAEVKRLLLKAQNEEKNTALHLAVKHGHNDIVDLLIRKEPGLTSITNKAGESPLFQAVDRGFFEIALRILDISECSDEGRNKMNVLHAAVIRVEISEYISSTMSPRHFVRKMLDKFPNAIMKADDFGWTPLHYAAYFGNFEVVKLFLENNNISLASKRDIQGMSALHISAREGHCDVMSAIIETFPYTCELLDNRGRTALHLAAESGRTKAVKILLSSSAFRDLINDQENEKGNTAMHLATIKRRYKVLILLADDTRVEKRATNKEGKTLRFPPSTTKKKKSVTFPSNYLQSEKLMLMRWDRGEDFLSLEQEVERETTEEQIAENEGHAAKVQGGTGAANNIVDLEELKKYNVVVMTLVTTVTFAAAFQVPGGYDSHGKANLVKSRDFGYFLMYDTFSFGSSAASLLIYFAMPAIEKMTFVQKIVQPLAVFLSMISLLSMYFAFASGIRAVLDEKSVLDSVARSNMVLLLGSAISKLPVEVKEA